MMDWQFNIIIVPGTLPVLAPAIYSLAEHLPCSFMLVGNGVDNEDNRYMKILAESHDRIEMQLYSTRNILTHGTILTLLALRERGEWFAFCDADIFASGTPSAWFKAALEVDAQSACTALLLEDVEERIGFHGRDTVTPTGTPLLSTYFTVYRTRRMQSVFQETGVGFEDRWNEAYFSPYEKQLARKHGWRGGFCDTGKLLGFEMVDRGCTLRHVEAPELLHIGGISWWLSRAAKSGWNNAPNTFTDSDLFGEKPENCTNDEHKKAMLNARRQGRSRWFSAYLLNLFGLGPKPVLRLSDSVEHDRIMAATDTIEHSFSLMPASLRMALRQAR